ncbi:putative rrna biogenesis protein [Neofusicoccum parvum UCRNP2]|uniref:Altered inheritance of mitochondria protein 6 n=1 Tax=Botryosphaeria parva (strain UCR-NP2) TaxID=1287680 RepID=R1G1H3_BOTPV|nr:putative rrna biogenesis protein [Neofusicoccum parvum UCRNP2]
MPQGELTRGITPIRCHSHNDYWRRVPLFDALAAGCTSVEADIWPADGLASPLSLYIDPITAILEHRSQANGTGDARSPTVFDADDSTPASLVLLLDFKDRSPALWAAVQAQLQPLRNRGWLTRWDRERGARVTRAVTVVATGDAPFDAIVGAAHRDVFYDAPLDRLDASIR